MIRKQFGVVAVILMFGSVPEAIYGQDTPVVRADITRTADGFDAAGRLDREEVAEDAWYDRHELALGVDGNLPGNLRVFDDSGKLIPARVKLYFLQSGKVVSQATPNDDGDFQVVGLKAGAYSIVAAGQSGFAALGVRVLPPPERAEPPKANTIGRIRAISQPGLGIGLSLNIPVIPAVDVQPAFGLAASANAGGLGSVPGLSGLGGAPGASAGASAAGSSAAGGGAGGGGAAGAGGGGLGGLGALGAAGAGLAASQGSGQESGSGSGTGNTTSSGGTPASANGSN
jgi:hypothetical protein